MAITREMHNELSRVKTSVISARKAEVATILRFAGGLHIVGSRVIIEAELSHAAVAHRLQHDIAELYGQQARLQSIAGGSSRKPPRFLLRIVSGGESLARQTGLLDQRGRPVRGLPPHIVSGSEPDIEACWRGALLVSGSLADPARSAALEVACPGPEAALALVGAARRLGVAAKSREVRGADRVVIRDADAILEMLTIVGAPTIGAQWRTLRAERELRAPSSRLANFDDANQRRSARAAVTAAARVSRALEILGDQAPDHLAAAGRLRIKHGDVSLEELGALSDPPLTKDAIAGRIRRLLSIADKHARQVGVPDTHSAVTPEMLDT